jgi:hypothetical protein
MIDINYMIANGLLNQLKPHPCAQVIREFNECFIHSNPHITRSMKISYNKHGIDSPCFEYIKCFNGLFRCGCSKLISRVEIEVCKRCNLECCASCYDLKFNIDGVCCDACYSECSSCDSFTLSPCRCTNCDLVLCTTCVHKFRLSPTKTICLCDESCMTEDQQWEMYEYMDECRFRKKKMLAALSDYNVPCRENSMLFKKYVSGGFEKKRFWTLEKVVQILTENHFLYQYTSFPKFLGSSSTRMAKILALNEHGLTRIPIAWPWVHKVRTDHKVKLTQVHEEMSLIPSGRTYSGGALFFELCSKYKDYSVLFEKKAKDKDLDKKE